MSNVHLLLKRATRAALLVLLLCVAGVTNAFAQTFTVGNLNYSVNEDGATVTVTGHVDGENASGELMIPESVSYEENTYSVTIIGGYAFYECLGLTGSLILPNSISQIGDAAFYRCWHLTGSLILPNSLISIGNSAFAYCGFDGELTIGAFVSTIKAAAFRNTSFTAIYVLADVPPQFGAGGFAFEGCDLSIPVTIPCGSLSAYQESGPWINFTNFQEASSCQGIIFAEAATGGSVSNAGCYTYEYGQTCILVATPNEDYAFVNWTEDGVEVSDNPQYSFIVSSNRHLVANFRYIRYEVSVVLCPGDGGTLSAEGMSESEMLDVVCDFSDGLQGWTTIDADGDGHDWYYGNGYVVSRSWYNNVILHPDNYLVSPGVVLGGTMTFKARAENEIYAAEHFGVAVSTTGTNASDFTLVQEWTMSAKGVGNWYEYTVDLSTFGGSYGYVAIRHFNSSDMDRLAVDDVVITAPSLLTLYKGSFLEGQTCSLTIVPNTDWRFFNWVENGNVVSTETEYSFSVLYDTFIAARFKEAVAIDFADPNVEALCGINWDANGDAFLTFEEAAAVTDLGSVFENHTDVVSFDELQYFTGLSEIADNAFNGCVNLNSIIIPESVTAIGNMAFKNCYSLDSIVLGDNIQTIGDEAFRNCVGLQGELTLPETLLSVGDYAFAGCDEITTINFNATNCTEMGNAQSPVFYDCASIAHINIGENVQNIPNYAFKRCSTVVDMTVAAVVPPTIGPSTFATISRSTPVSVPFGSGDAYRNAPYWEEFFNITEDYSPNPYTYHWSVNVHQFADNMTIIGIIQIDGEEQMTDALEIGAFCGDECRGRQLLTYFPDFDRYLLFLTIYGEDGDALSFRLYDHEAGAEIDKGCTTHLNFLTDDIIGTLTEPHPFNFVAMQDVQFATGWNWWSGYVELGDDGLTLLQEGLDTHGILIKSQNNGFVSYLDGFGWYGSLASINNENTYQIRVSEACALGIAGAAAQPAEHPISLNSGWNWIGYPVSTGMTIAEALSGLTPQTNDMLKSQNDGFVSYLEGFGWYGSLNTLQPGMGLMYKSNNNSAVTLVYPSGGSKEELKANQTAGNNHWQPNLNAYPDNMSVMAVVELDGEELQGENYELAAFANGEVRGSARLLYVEPLNRYMAFLTVAGDEAAELRFGLYNTETGEVETQSISSLRYETNAVVGSFAEPYVVSFRGNTGMDEWASSLNVYPNPVHRGQIVSLGFGDAETGEVQVEIVNVLGAVVETQRAKSLQGIIAPETAGVYTLRVTFEGKVTRYQKLIVR